MGRYQPRRPTTQLDCKPKCKLKWMSFLCIGIVLSSYIRVIVLHSSQSISVASDFEIVSHKQTSEQWLDIDCAQYQHVKDIHNIDDILNSTLPEIMQYLSQLHCPQIQSNPAAYIDDFSQPMQLDIAHVLNMYNADIHDYSYLFFAAPVTFLSMWNAKNYARQSQPNISVGLYASSFKEDADVIPLFINKLPHLKRSLLDSEFAQNLTHPKRMPFLTDIIDSLLQHVRNAKFVIYTNADIGVQPNFYVEVMKLLTQYPSGLSITRKLIEYTSNHTGELFTFLNMDDIYAHALSGRMHGGHDCFVFRSDSWKDFDMTNVFLGYPPIGNTFAAQMESLFGETAAIIRDRYLTFHIGTTRHMTRFLNRHGWRQPNQSVKYDDDYFQHTELNRAFCDAILQKRQMKSCKNNSRLQFFSC